VGWLWHRRIHVTLLLDGDSRGLARITRRGRRGRLEIRPDAPLSPKYLEDLFDGPDGSFLLWRSRRGDVRLVGGGSKVTRGGVPRLFWIKQADLDRLSREVRQQMSTAVKTYALPDEDLRTVLTPGKEP
jgi:hypothetical protein